MSIAPLTPEEFAWQELLFATKSLDARKGFIDHWLRERWTHAAVLARVSGTSYSLEPEKVIGKAERAIRR